MDVSPKQLVSVAAALIPFLEHDDANRALMGSNMQRQAVPLLRTEAPSWAPASRAWWPETPGSPWWPAATGSSRAWTRPGSSCATRRSEGDAVDTGVDIYTLTKFQRSNQNTCLNQRPIVRVGDAVRAGDVIADGPATSQGRAGPGQERAGRLHELGRLQLRGLDHHLRADAGEGHLHLDPHRGVRVRGAGHQARQGGDHPRHPQRGRAQAQGPGRDAASCASGPR